mgnify:CR=1 FL=1
MLIKFLKHFFIIFLILFLQIAVIPNLPSVFAQLNLILVMIVFVSVVFQFYLGVIYAFVWGFVLDIYSALPFGAILISLVITLYVVYEIFQRFLTNKSFYTLLGLVSVATVLFNFFLLVYSALLFFSASKDMQLIYELALAAVGDIWRHLLMNLALSSIFFMIFHFSSRRFKAVFIDTTKA